jgi:hypothetical protein
MNVLYRALGVSKQSFHQRQDREMSYLEAEKQLLELITRRLRNFNVLSEKNRLKLIFRIR